GLCARLERCHFALEGALESARVDTGFRSDFSRTPVTVSALYYLNPRQRMRVYGLFGTGVVTLVDGGRGQVSGQIQAGAGVDLKPFRRLSLESDLRTGADDNGALVTVNGGLSLRF